MILSDEGIKTLITIIGTFATSLLTVGKYFKGQLKEFHDALIMVRCAVNELDKKLAVQTALFQTYMGREFDGRDHRNKENDRVLK
jgi:hypothetical protein